MHVIVCLDDRGGMLFHQRRQSRDRAVQSDILQMCRGEVLWMNRYSQALFPDAEGNAIRTAEDFLEQAGAGEYCFVETCASLRPYEKNIEHLILYRWNRHYPSDARLDLDPAAEGWRQIGCTEFPGHSHERITKEVYTR
ncbi:hypothetical protein I4200191B4_13230 [Pseudoflavonifractor gallinarum]|uniref:hypothetical protein n=1 Tax=Pseudoflavonifractor gallinarum TaxID=2779352 RepID=UPI0036F29AC6